MPDRHSSPPAVPTEGTPLADWGMGGSSGKQGSQTSQMGKLWAQKRDQKVRGDGGRLPKSSYARVYVHPHIQVPSHIEHADTYIHTQNK